MAMSSQLDLAIPIDGGLQHSELADSWLVIGHDEPAPSDAWPATWTPTMSARPDGSLVELESLRALFVEDQRLSASFGPADEGLLRVEFAPHCDFTADDGSGAHATNRGQFFRELRGDDVSARVALGRNGRAFAFRAHRCRAHDGPLLLGRITALDADNDRFDLHVVAQVRRHGCRLLLPSVTVRVDTADARLRRPNGDPLVFSDLAVGQLARVAWTERSEVPDEPDLFTASVVTVVAVPASLFIPWQGSVDGVDTAASTIVVVPRNDDPIVINGVSVPQVTLDVDDDTILVRRAPNGPGTTIIELDDVEIGDRIWFRGDVTGPDTLDAVWIRVREE
jgi:hypothetical protein